jgi:hypothetical protein
VHHLWVLTIRQGRPISLKIPVSVVRFHRIGARTGHQVYGFRLWRKHKHYLPVFTNPAAATYVCSADGRASESGESGNETARFHRIGARTGHGPKGDRSIIGNCNIKSVTKIDLSPLPLFKERVPLCQLC